MRGVTQATFEMDLPEAFFEDFDTSVLYTKICQLFPDNPWHGLVCDNLEVGADRATCIVTSF